ncbi:MAG: glycosyltransferase [Chloroflexi bacterium]|nr:glycosyltransferase [Chloroflexota bacterium]
MKILYVQDTDWIRRNPMQHNHLAERMVLRGHEVRVIDYEILWRAEGKKELFSKRQTFRVARLLRDAYHTVIRPGIVKIPLLDYVSMLFTYTQEINRQVGEFKPDVIIADCILTPFLAFRVAKRKHVPVVYYVLDVSHKLIPFRLLHPLGRMIERWNFRSADLVISGHSGLREYCLRMGAAPEKTRAITAGIDVSRFRPAADGAEVRKKYKIDRNDLVLFFVGWIHHFQGLKEVAIEMAKVGDSRIKLMVVGDGDGYDDLDKIRRESGLNGRLILTGRKPYDEVPSFLAAADICILPSPQDEPVMQGIVPIKIYDYVTARKPVISTRLSGVVNEIGEGNGIVYVERPEDTVRQAMELARNGAIKQLAEQAGQFAARHSWDKVTDEFEQTLLNVAGGKEL